MGLSKRLKTLADLVSRGDRVADIGTDHAYLPIYLVNKKICQQIKAGELNAGPFQAAIKNIKEAGLEEYIDVRQGNGLAVVEPGEVDTVIVSGMGGAAIVEILQGRREVVRLLQKLILQPMADEALLRHWLVENGWVIEDEKLIFEDDKLYTVVKAKPGSGQKLTPEQIAYGPKLLEKRDPLLKIKLENELQHKREIKEQIEKRGSIAVEKRLQELAAEIDGLERVLQWLSSVKQS